MFDIIWIQAFHMLLQMFSTITTEELELSVDKIDEMFDSFMSAITYVEI